MADTHNLTGSFHLSGKGSLSCNKFIKWKSRDLNYAVVKHWLETCICFSCDRIRDLIQCISKCDLRCNLCDRVTSCLTCKCRGTGLHEGLTSITPVFEAVWFQCVLNVTSACNSKLCDNVQGQRYGASGTLCLQESGTEQLRWSLLCGHQPGQCSPCCRQ